jgi:hypothetical protein
MRDSPNQAAHDHTLGPKLGASSLTRYLSGLGVKIVHTHLSSSVETYGVERQMALCECKKLGRDLKVTMAYMTYHKAVILWLVISWMYTKCFSVSLALCISCLRFIVINAKVSSTEIGLHFMVFSILTEKLWIIS